MKIRDYISQKFAAWNITDANLIDISQHIDVDEEYSIENDKVVGQAMIKMLEELILSPVMKNVSENGFSVSWDYSNIGQYYMWLCRRYGIEPDTEVVAALGLSTIIDKTDIW